MATHSSVLWPENPMNRGACVAFTSPRGREESDATEHLFHGADSGLRLRVKQTKAKLTETEARETRDSEPSEKFP